MPITLGTQLIEVRDLVIGYNRQPITRSLSFTIDTGELFLIRGDNGTGKSTLLRTLAGLIPPVSGTIKLKTKQIKSWVAQNQQTQTVLPFTAREMIELGIVNHKFNSDSASVLIMQKLGIEPLANKQYSQLSGGQQQKIMLARALVSSPQIVFLDEPTEGLDADSRKSFLETVFSIIRDDSCSVIITTHDSEALSQIDNENLAKSCLVLEQ
ncbi:MAG: ATP-binding cassette domain-containing protein [bacterium]|nr:ATP-binding cassette domain-containing protein [bacterium]